MLIKNTNTLIDSVDAESLIVANIVHEVNKHGFYSAYSASLIANAHDHDDLIQRIKIIASTAQVSVSFNATGELCIFEASV